MEYVTRQMQGDFVVLDQREQNLFADAGMVTGPADWTLAFDAGMSFQEWHAPVPLAHEAGVFDRALRYLLQLRLNQPVRRLNHEIVLKDFDRLLPLYQYVQSPSKEPSLPGILETVRDPIEARDRNVVLPISIRSV